MNKIKHFCTDVAHVIGTVFTLIKGLTLTAMLLFGIVSIYLIYVTAVETVNQYHETLNWKNTSYEQPLAEIEPTLVSNRIDTGIVNAAASWDALETYVQELDGNSIGDRDHAEELLEDALKWQETYHLTSDAPKRLSLYLELDKALTDVYATMDLAPLKALSEQLYSLELTKQTKAGQRYMERIREVASDFEAFEQLMTKTIGSIGTVEDDIWIIPCEYTRDDLEEALEQLQTMRKFSAVSQLTRIASDMTKVINYNKNASEYFAYQEFLQLVKRLGRSAYVGVSSIYTYEQALSAGCQVDATAPEGSMISPDSPVTGIYHEGERLDGSEYFRKGAVVVAEIDPVYEPIVTEEETWQGEEVYEPEQETETVPEDPFEGNLWQDDDLFREDYRTDINEP